jgi:uncharacterized membrane protein YeaQ/YmgE (transglycosylase-associated protein family)
MRRAAHARRRCGTATAGIGEVPARRTPLRRSTTVGYTAHMGLLLYLILLVLSGLVVGGLARLALPGPDPMGIGKTILIGIAGSFIGGLIMWAITGRDSAGIVVSVACATAIVYLIRRSRGGSLTDPGLARRRRP